MAKNKIVLSLGGSIIVPDEIDIYFLKKFCKLLVKQIKTNQFFIITGGGKTCRNYQQAAQAVMACKDVDLDWLGIYSTQLNAQLLRSILKFKINIFGATNKPGRSTDYMAVSIAIKHKIKRVINLSNIKYVYNKDPKKFKKAKKIKDISWTDFRSIVGNKWKPGLNIPFDPLASKLAQKHKIEVIMAKGTDLKNLKNILANKKFKGTIIHP